MKKADIRFYNVDHRFYIVKRKEHKEYLFKLDMNGKPKCIAHSIIPFTYQSVKETIENINTLKEFFKSLKAVINEKES